MEKKQFKGEFNVLDYNISHKVLLLRRHDLSLPMENLDLIFESVFYMEIITRLNDIIIYQADIKTTDELQKRFSRIFYPQFGQVFYILESEGGKFIIGCGRYLVKENSLDYLESSIRE
jgi:hypothetical protein